MSSTKTRPNAAHSRIIVQGQNDDDGTIPEVEIEAPPAPAPHPEPDQPKKWNDYSGQIARFQAMLAHHLQQRNFASSKDAAFIAESEIDQFRRAIDLYQRAEYVEPRVRQFGTHRSKVISLRLPPKTMSFLNREDLKLVGDHYRVITDDPRFITLLLDMVAARAILDLREMKLGLTAVFSHEGVFAKWHEPEVVLTLQEAGMMRNW